MPKCTWRDRPADEELCRTIASAGKSLCPRHEFMQQLKDQKKEARNDAEANHASKQPRTRAALLKDGYHFTGSSECRGCNKRIEWWNTKNGKSMPFDPMPIDTSSAVTHFVTCSRANEFRRVS